jgi:hypothetical protein
MRLHDLFAVHIETHASRQVKNASESNPRRQSSAHETLEPVSKSSGSWIPVDLPVMWMWFLGSA